MISYKDIFKTLLRTDGYISINALKQHIEMNKTLSIKESSLDKEITRKWDRFVKVGLLNKVYNGTDTVYTLSKFTKKLHNKHGTDKLLRAYEIIELVNDNEFNTILENLSLLMGTNDDTPSIGFYTLNQEPSIHLLNFFFKIIAL